MREIKRGHKVLLALLVVALGAVLHRVFQAPRDPSQTPDAEAPSPTGTADPGAIRGSGEPVLPVPADAVDTVDTGETSAPDDALPGLLVARVEAALERPRGVRLTGEVLDVARQALASVQVEALRLEVRSPGEGPRPVVLQQTASGPDGRFLLRLEGRPGEEVSLRLRHASHALRHLPLGPLPDGGDLDLGSILLDEGFVAHGEVRDDESGAPIAGARLSFLPEELVGQTQAEAQVGESDERGRFQVSGIGADLVRVQVEASGHARARMAMVPLLRHVDERNSMSIHLVAAHSLGGTVRDRFGANVAGAEVKVERLGALSTCEATIRSGAGGAFRFPDLEEGYYVIKVRHPDHAEFVHLRAHTGVEDLDLRLDPLGSVVLTLPDLPDDRSVPVAVVPVHMPSQQARLPALMLEAVRGQLLVEGLEPGSWSLELRVPGTAPSRSGSFEVFAGRQTRLGIVRLEPASRIRGRVLDAEGQPLRAEVALCSSFLREALASRRSLFQLLDRRLVVTDADGTFLVDDVAGGVTALAVRARDHQEWRALELQVPACGTLDLGDVVLEPAATLSGQATSRDGEPRAGIVVELRGPQGSYQTTTDARGSYGFRGLEPGRYTVSASVIRTDERALEQALSPKAPTKHPVLLEAGKVTVHDLVVTATDQRLP